MTHLYDQDGEPSLPLDIDDLPPMMPIEEMPPLSADSAWNYALTVEVARQVDQEAGTQPSRSDRLCDLWALVRYLAAQLEPTEHDGAHTDHSAWFATILDPIGGQDPVADWWELPFVRRATAYYGMNKLQTQWFEYANSPVDLLVIIDNHLIDAISVLPGSPGIFGGRPALMAALDRAKDPFTRTQEA